MLDVTTKLWPMQASKLGGGIVVLMKIEDDKTILFWMDNTLIAFSTWDLAWTMIEFQVVKIQS